MSSDLARVLHCFVRYTSLAIFLVRWYNIRVMEEKTKRHIEVSGALFVEKGKVLAFEKGEAKYPYVSHKFEFPGGKLEKGEDPRRALRRELLEELDMTAEVYDIFDTVTHEYPDFTITLYVCLCRRLSDYKLKEHVRVVPLSSSELDPADWAPADAHTVSKIRSHLL